MIPERFFEHENSILNFKKSTDDKIMKHSVQSECILLRKRAYCCDCGISWFYKASATAAPRQRCSANAVKRVADNVTTILLYILNLRTEGYKEFTVKNDGR